MISEEERKAIEYYKNYSGEVELEFQMEESDWEEFKKVCGIDDESYENHRIKVTHLLKLIEIQNKMIELMAEYIEEAEIMHKAKFPFDMQKPDGLSLVQVANKQEIIEHFRTKAKESE